MKNQMVIKMEKDQFRIMAEMLEKVREGTLKIQPDDTYLIFMLRIGLLEEKKMGERVDYVPTKGGLTFPKDYENLVKLLDENPTSGPSCYRGKCTWILRHIDNYLSFKKCELYLVYFPDREIFNTE